MVNVALEAQRQTILHYWSNGVRSAKEIHEKASISLRTVERNLKKLRETGTVEHRRGNGRRPKITQNIGRAISQHIHRNNGISTRQIAKKLEATHDISISHVSVWKHMKKRGTRVLWLLQHRCLLSGTLKCEYHGLKRIWTTIGTPQYSPTKQHSTCFEIRFAGGTKPATDPSGDSQNHAKK